MAEQTSLTQLMTRQGNDLALSLVEHGLELEPDYAALAGLGAWAFAMRAAQDWSAASEEDQRKGLALAEKALALGQDNAEALSLAGYTIGYLGSRLNEGIRPLSGRSASTQTAHWRSPTPAG